MKKKGKKMKKNWKPLVLSLLLTFVFMLVSFSAPSAEAHGRGQGPCAIDSKPMPGRGFGPGGEDGPDMPRNFGQYLDLTVKQKQQMHDIKFAFLKKTLDAKGDIGTKRLERQTLLNNETIDWKKVDQLTDEIAKLQATMEKEKMRERVEIKKILTPEQLEKFDAMNGPQCQGRGPAGGPGCSQGRGMGMGMGMGKGPGCGMGKGMGF